MSEENKNAVAAGPRNDVKSVNKAGGLQRNRYRIVGGTSPHCRTAMGDRGMSRSTCFFKLMKRSYIGATRMLGYALTLHDYETWEVASAVWQARLSPEECAALAWAALRSLDLDYAREVANTVIQDAGAPLPPFISPMDEAAYWADSSSPTELDAYALACVQAMAPGRRAAFFEYMQGRKAA